MLFQSIQRIEDQPNFLLLHLQFCQSDGKKLYHFMFTARWLFPDPEKHIQGTFLRGMLYRFCTIYC